ncbi:MAG: Rab family GTPase [Promethearchaeota archaeon]
MKKTKLTEKTGFKLILYGPGYGGKTSVVNRFRNNEFKKDYIQTLGALYSIEEFKIKNQDYKLFIWDLAGVKNFRFTLPAVMKGVDGLLMVFDLNSVEDYSEIQEYLSFTQKFVRNEIPLIIIGNKKDLINEDYLVEKREEIRQYTQDQNGEYFETSAKAGENIETIFRKITYKMFKNMNETEAIDLSDIKFKGFEEIIITEELILKAHDLIVETNKLITQNELEQAKIVITQAENFAIKNRLGKTLRRIHNVEKKLNVELNHNKELLIRNKINIHKLIHAGELNRCPLHEEINTNCMKIEKIKGYIEDPIIYGFFMYQFPKKDEKKYQLEISKIMELIHTTNMDPFININLPSEVTSLDIKTCDFCKFARAFDFGLLVLNPVNPNAYLEAGMFLSYGKKVILLNNESRSFHAPFDLSPYFYIPYSDLEDLERNWYRKMPEYIQNIKKFYLTEIKE